MAASEAECRQAIVEWHKQAERQMKGPQAHAVWLDKYKKHIPMILVYAIKTNDNKMEQFIGMYVGTKATSTELRQLFGNLHDLFEPI